MPVKRKTKQIKKEKPKITKASTKITKKHKASVTVREDKDVPYKKGDFCFYLTRNNKIHFAEVHSAHEHEHEHEQGQYYYQIVDQFEYRFVTTAGKHCADDEKSLKGKRWSK